MQIQGFGIHKLRGIQGGMSRFRWGFRVVLKGGLSPEHPKPP